MWWLCVIAVTGGPRFRAGDCAPEDRVSLSEPAAGDGRPVFAPAPGLHRNEPPF